MLSTPSSAGLRAVSVGTPGSATAGPEKGETMSNPIPPFPVGDGDPDDTRDPDVLVTDADGIADADRLDDNDGIIDDEDVLDPDLNDDLINSAEADRRAAGGDEV